ncbi:hypothetical protein [Nocardioides marmoraquaticus]
MTHVHPQCSCVACRLRRGLAQHTPRNEPIATGTRGILLEHRQQVDGPAGPVVDPRPRDFGADVVSALASLRLVTLASGHRPTSKPRARVLRRGTHPDAEHWSTAYSVVQVKIDVACFHPPWFRCPDTAGAPDAPMRPPAGGDT